MNWDSYRAFLIVVRSGTLKAAARELDVAEQTARRRLDALEDRCGFPLFLRRRAGLEPTPEARRLAALIGPLEQRISAASRNRVSPLDDLDGRVRVAATEDFGPSLTSGVFRLWRDLHPGLTIEQVWTVDDDAVALANADIRVETRAEPPDAAERRNVGQVRLGLFAQAGYLAAEGAPTRPGQLKDHVLVGPESAAGRQGMIDSFGLSANLAPEDIAFRTESPLGRHRAIRAGVGIGPGELHRLRDAPDVRRVLESTEALADVWVSMADGLAEIQRVRRLYEAVIEHLTAELRQG